MLPNNSPEWDAARTPRPRRGGRATARTLVAVALVGALVGGAVDRLATGANLTTGLTPPTLSSLPRVGPVAAPETAPADQAQQAIQQVIQHGDEEQAQAIAAKDPSGMADTSTSDHYQQMVQTNQDLLDNGVTAIKLIKIEWGPITVNGATATATATETWSTTYEDGTTEQSRDRNVYTLVQDNGSWKVQADDHPDEDQIPGASAGAPGAPDATSPAPARPRPSGPGVPGSQNESNNWSGYAATGGSFTAVNGTWTVPQFMPDSPAGADAAWVGIGGVRSRDLIQAGTQESVSGNGRTHYEAWVETLPQASHPVPLTVNPGDSVTAAISQQGPDTWQIAFTNNTTGQSYQVSEHYASSMSSAEWVEEAPSAMRGRILPLDNFGTVSFSGASAVKDGQTVNIAQAGGRAITMMSSGGQALAAPSALAADGASFTVSRTAAESSGQTSPGTRRRGPAGAPTF